MSLWHLPVPTFGPHFFYLLNDKQPSRTRLDRGKLFKLIDGQDLLYGFDIFMLAPQGQFCDLHECSHPTKHSPREPLRLDVPSCHVIHYRSDAGEKLTKMDPCLGPYLVRAVCAKSLEEEESDTYKVQA